MDRDGIVLTQEGDRIAKASGPKITASRLEIGKTYLRTDLWRYRTILSIFENQVYYIDAVGPGNCSKSHFVTLCKTEATSAECKFLKVMAVPPIEGFEVDLFKLQGEAMLIAMAVRNALEDFHVQNIPEIHMKELNQTIRNGIYTGLHALRFAKSNPGANIMVQEYARSIPPYWEKPEFLNGYSELIQKA